MKPALRAPAGWGGSTGAIARKPRRAHLPSLRLPLIYWGAVVTAAARTGEQTRISASAPLPYRTWPTCVARTPATAAASILAVSHTSAPRCPERRRAAPARDVFERDRRLHFVNGHCARRHREQLRHEQPCDSGLCFHGVTSNQSGELSTDPRVVARYAKRPRTRTRGSPKSCRYS